jgi:ABC-2 type transport system permease protein
MARLLVQLKLRLLTNALHSSRRAKVSFIISTVFAGLVAVGTFWVLAALRGGSSPVAQTASVFTVFAFGWLIIPLVAFGLDATLDLATLALYPVRTRPLATGLLAASATGAWPLANVIGLLGVTIGLARTGAAIAIALVAVALQVLFCIALARLVTTGLAGLLRSRRGTDVAAFAVVPIFALYEAFAQVVPRLAAEGKITAATFAHIDRWLRWLPPGLAAHAIGDASAGRVGTGLLLLALLAAIIIAIAWLWVRTLSRALVTMDTSTQASAVRGRPLPFPRGGIRGTVAGRYLIYQRREPSAIVRWCILAVVMVAASVSTIRTPAYHVALVLSAVLAGGMLCLFNANWVGVTGSAFTLEASALSGQRAVRSYIAGRNIALGVIAVPLAVIFSFGLAAFAGHPLAGFLALPLDLAAIGVGLALSSLYAVLLAYPAVKRVGSPIPNAADGHGGQAFAATIGSFFGVPIVITPVILAVVTLTTSLPDAVRFPVLALCAAAYGLVAAWAAGRWAAALASARMPELCQVALSSKL